MNAKRDYSSEDKPATSSCFCIVLYLVLRCLHNS